MKLEDKVPFDNSNCPECQGNGNAYTCGICYVEHDTYNKKMGYWGVWSWCDVCQDLAKDCEH